MKARAIEKKRNGLRPTNVNRAYETIKGRILDNDYPPGHQALETDLADSLGMSRTPIREAMVRLENEGLIEIIPRQGMRVIPLSAADMKEIYEILTALETMAVDLIARQRPSEKDLSEMEETLLEMDRALERDDLDAWAAADSRFHFSLLGLCGNRRLASMAHQVSDQAHRARMLTLRLRPKPVNSNSEHRAVLDAIRRGDWQAARQIHYDHRKRAAEVLLNLLDHYRLTNL